MEYLPLSVDLRGKLCLVVGGGEVAQRKLESLLAAGAHVRLVAPEVNEGIQTLLSKAGVVPLVREYRTTDLLDVWLVVAATNSTKLHRAVFDQACARQIQVNTVDQPDLCTLIFPSVISRGPVSIAISTSGRSPTLARVLRGWLEQTLPNGVGALADYAWRIRDRVKAQFTEVGARQQFWQRVFDSSVVEKIYQNNLEEADRTIDKLMVSELSQIPGPGWVALIGAGPGDPELLTLKGLRYLQRADVILHDNLVSAEILAYGRKDAKRIYVGKKMSGPSHSQDDINQQMVGHAQQGENVVRLKGGDPFVFGRGGEELEALSAHDIEVVVVPGITAALGCASYLGIPLTHRDVAQSVRFVTGHRLSGETNLDWPELAKPGQTLVIYMGLPGLQKIVDTLVANGMPATTAGIVIAGATLPEQTQVQASIVELPSAVAAAKLTGPTTIIIGEVVSYAAAWSSA